MSAVSSENWRIRYLVASFGARHPESASHLQRGESFMTRRTSRNNFPKHPCPSCVTAAACSGSVLDPQCSTSPVDTRLVLWIHA